MNKKIALSTLACLSTFSVMTVSHAETKHDHDAHEHGIAQMNIAWDKDHLDIEMVSPAYNIVGFEHQPKTEEQHEAAESVEAILSNPASLIDATTCELEEADIDSPFEEHDDQDDHDHDEEHKDHDEHRKDHDKHEHDEHGHDDHKEHDKHDHDEHDHDEESVHSEYELSYKYHCENSASELTLNFAGLFNQLPNMEEIRVQWLSETQQNSAELSKSNTTLTLK